MNSRACFQRADAAVADVFEKPGRVEQFQNKLRINGGVHFSQRSNVRFRVLAHVYSLKGCDLARFAEHLVDLVEVQFFEQDHFAGIFLKRNRLALGQLQQLVIGLERRAFLLETFAKNVADVVL